MCLKIKMREFLGVQCQSPNKRFQSFGTALLTYPHSKKLCFLIHHCMWWAWNNGSRIKSIFLACVPTSIGTNVALKTNLSNVFNVFQVLSVPLVFNYKTTYTTIMSAADASVYHTMIRYDAPSKN